MDGLTFLADCLDALPLNYSPAGAGMCDSHHQPAAMLYNFNRERICRGCALLRQTYPSAKGQLRLGLGNYMLLTPTTVAYWGNLLLPAPIIRQPASGALRTLVRDLILTPPEPPWLFMAFARSNSPERLRVTTSNDLIYFSGKFYFPGTMDEPSVERLNRTRVLAMREAATLTRKEWEAYVRAHATLNNSTDSLNYLQDLYRRFPSLARLPVPVAKTPEYNALRLCAEDR